MLLEMLGSAITDAISLWAFLLSEPTVTLFGLNQLSLFFYHLQSTALLHIEPKGLKGLPEKWHSL